MDAYGIGLVGILFFLGLFTAVALFFFSLETVDTPPTKKPPYTQVECIDTNTIETVDITGQVQRWQRLAD